MTSMFISHGSPMTAIEENKLTNALGRWGNENKIPDYILAISAHWVTNKLSLNSPLRHTTMYDFGGFPSQLYEVKYEPEGYPKAIKEVENILQKNIQIENSRGLDHGVWSVAKWLYPKYDVPILQLSIEAGISLQEHFDRGQKLASLSGNVLLLASGGVTHNLSLVNFGKNNKPQNWALEFDRWVKKSIEKNWDDLIHPDKKFADLFYKAHPTIEHYIPMLYALGASSKLNKKPIWLSEDIEMGTLSSRSVVWN